MTKTAGVSIATLNVRKGSDTPFEFEYVDSSGSNSGIFFKVLGSQSDTITKAINVLVNERRSQEAVRLAKNQRAASTFTPVEDDIEFGQRLAAVRLVGWRRPGDTDGLSADQLSRFQGIEEAYSPELALTLCQTNPDIAAQVLAASNDLGNFTLASPKT